MKVFEELGRAPHEFKELDVVASPIGRGFVGSKFDKDFIQVWVNGKAFRILPEDLILMYAVEQRLDENCDTEGGVELTHLQEGKWIYSTDNEIFTTSNYFDTKEQAIEGGKADYTWKGECPTFYVGQVKSVDFSIYVDPDSILERIAETVYDEVGEVANEYLNDVKKEHFNVLEEELNEVVHQWMDRFGYNPKFFNVISIEKVML